VSGSFWEKRCHDRTVRDAEEFTTKLDYIHRNPVKRGLVKEAELWKWSSYRHYATHEVGPVEIESEWTARDRERKNKGGE
jgi:putative transposase